MTAKAQIKLRARAVEIAPGGVVLNLSGASGGVTYRSSVVTDRVRARSVRRVESLQVKTIDNASVVREIDAVVKNVDDTVMRQLCVKMSFGHFLPDVNRDRFHAEIAELRGKMTALNAMAAAVGSHHRGRIGALTPALDVTDSSFVIECRRTVAQALTDVLDALRAGDHGDGAGSAALRPALLRAKNIHMLVDGDAHAALLQAFERTRSVRTELRELINAGVSREEAGAGANLRDIETAIKLFEVP